MIDLNTHEISDAFQALLDKTIVDKETRSRVPRQYLGASRLGAECLRSLQFEIMDVDVDAGSEIEGRIYRIFYRGHQGEEWLKMWLTDAGFTIEGTQDGFYLCDNLISGHCDGIITAGHESFAPYPRLWECKVLGNKGISKLKNNRLRKAYPVYYAQVQIYMAALGETWAGLDSNPALFTALNADTMTIYAESVEFDGEYAQQTYTRGEQVIRACQDNYYLPRISNAPSMFVCKMCSWQNKCHSMTNDIIE
jgi:hypothetical protein